MAWRQLPDGSWFDGETGDLRGFDEAREASARAQSIRTGTRGARGLAGEGLPTWPMPQQKFIAVPGNGRSKAILDPQSRLLAVNPYELGLGQEPMSDTKKRILLIGLIVAAAGGYVWFNNRKGK